MSTRMQPGIRMVTQAARMQMVDNAVGIARTATHCDLSQPAQVTRYETLVDLEQQQIGKARDLKDALEEDADNRHTTPINTERGARRKAQDAKKAGKHIAGKKHRERMRSIRHHNALSSKFFRNSNPLVLTVRVQGVEDTSLMKVDCLSMGGVRRWTSEAPSNLKFGVLKQWLVEHFKYRKLRLVSPHGVDITGLHHRFPVDGLDSLEEDSCGQGGDSEEEPEMLLPMVSRNMKRKKDSVKRKAAKQANRNKNKKQRRCLEGRNPGPSEPLSSKASSQAVFLKPSSKAPTPKAGLLGTTSKASAPKWMPALSKAPYHHPVRHPLAKAWPIGAAPARF